MHRSFLPAAFFALALAACDGSGDDAGLPDFPNQPAGTFSLRLDARPAVERMPHAQHAQFPTLGEGVITMDDGAPDANAGAYFERNAPFTAGTYRLGRDVSGTLMLGNIAGTTSYRFVSGTLRVREDGNVLRGVFTGMAEYVEGPWVRKDRWEVEGAFAAEPGVSY